MIVFEGNLCKPSWRSKHQVVFEDEDDEMTDLASTMSSVFASVWEANIDTNVSTSFAVSLSVEQCSSSSSDVAFCKAMNVRGDISKLSVSIGSYNFSFEP